MARFHNIEHQLVVEPLAQAAGLTVERVRRFDYAAPLPELERWSQWSFRITRGGTRFASHAALDYTLAPNTIMWHGPLRDPIRLRGLPGSADQIVLRFSGARWRDWLDREPRFAERHAAVLLRPVGYPITALTAAPPQVLLVIRDLLSLSEALRPSAPAIEAQCALLLHLIGDLHFDRQPPAIAGERRQRVEAAQSLLAGKLEAPPALSDLAAAINVSPRQLQRDFLACTGLTPRRYLNIMRLSEANMLLADTSLPIAVIARQLGYCSQAHFSAAFKQVYRCSPRRFRAGLHEPAFDTPQLHFEGELSV